MKALTAVELLRAWEGALAQPPSLRALALLAAVDSGVTLDDLARLPLGQRDARLLALREATFGAQYRALVSCPSCDERLELSFAAYDVRPIANPRGVPAPVTLRLGDYTLEIRPIDSTDLAVAAECPDVATARAVLARRCIEAARRSDLPVAAEGIPEGLIGELSAHLGVVDPEAETTVEVSCAACGARWDAALDIAGYLWTEIETEAHGLLRDVHALARGYGWREADILALSPLRRRAYLQLVQA